MATNEYSIDRYGRNWQVRVDDDIMELSYAQNQFCEQPMLDWIEQNVPCGGIWVDAGANIGNHTLPFSLWADLVIALEPVDCNMHLLRHNIVVNKVDRRVMCLQVGVGVQHAFMRIVPGGGYRNSQFRLEEGTSGAGIHVLPIDHILPTDAEVRLIKLDVEGMEGQALLGAWNTIGIHKPELFIEIWEQGELSRIRAVLSTMGYALIERWNEAPTYHFSASGRYAITYTEPPT